MQRMEGNLVATIREHIEEIAHVQVADSPGRGEPGTGEINYPYVLGQIEESGYDGYVGLEYNPTTQTTEESFGWLPRTGARRGWRSQGACPVAHCSRKSWRTCPKRRI